jgi:phosphopentomutase
VPIIAEHCEEHLRTGWPICYTSADSVFQIAAHEEAFGLERLLQLCQDLAPMLHARKVGRVIARPFTGSCGDFKRTSNRHDYAIAPPAADAFGLGRGRGAGDPCHRQDRRHLLHARDRHLVEGKSDADLFEHLVRLGAEAEPGSLTFANFVEFDTLYGHPRDVAGYARALEWFDAGLPRFFAALRPGDLAIFTADHGNDPTWRGTEHTRERVPLVGWGAGLREVGLRGFVDVGASIAAHLGVKSQGPGRSFL